MSALLADRRLYLTRDKSRVVEEGSREAGYLLAGAGQWIPADQVARYRLSHVDGRIVLPAIKQAAASENKMAAQPENKAAASIDVEVPEPADEPDVAGPAAQPPARRYGKRGRPTPPSD